MSNWKDGGSVDGTGEVGVDGACTVVCPGDTVPELLGSGVSFGTTIWLATGLGVSPVLIMQCRFLQKTAPLDPIRKLRGPAESRQVAGVQTFCPGSLICTISPGLTLGRGFACRS